MDLGLVFHRHRHSRVPHEPGPIPHPPTAGVGVDDRLAARIAGLAAHLGPGWAVSTGVDRGGIVVVPATEPEAVSLLRQRRPGVSVVVVTRRPQLAPWQDTVAFLDAGADRVLVSPTNDELAAHIVALSRSRAAS
ncbi:MAG: hypothetical protein JWP02_2532 [Acidimicrobiales bacterium]|nr:hypothetical protein [Acidimicrobiales bacterium]